MAKNNNEEVIANVETSDDLQAQIEALQKKLATQQIAETGEEVQTVKLPLATIELKINKNNSVRLRNVTPPEAAFLVAEHHARSGGAPILKIEMQKDDEQKQMFANVDPRSYRVLLGAKYHPKKINVMFPGLVPSFPTSFTVAVKSGLETQLPNERLMDFEVQPAGASNA